MPQEETQQIAQDRILDLLESATKKRNFDVQKVNQGFENEVYIADSTDDSNQNYAVRIRRKGDTDFDQEAWAIEESGKAGAPVAKIILLTNIEDTGENLQVMVQQKISGVPLEDLRESLSEDQKESLLFQTGEALRKIHSIQTGGFGKRLNDGTWEYANWTEYMKAFIDERQKEIPQLIESGISKEDCESSLSILKQYRDQFPSSGVLCHGDFMPRHIFSKDGNLTGIIDFGLFRGNTPFYDLAYFDLNSPADFINLVRKGYESGGEILDFDKRLSMEKLLLIIKHLGKLSHPYRKHRANEIPFWHDLLKKNLNIK